MDYNGLNILNKQLYVVFFFFGSIHLVSGLCISTHISNYFSVVLYDTVNESCVNVPHENDNQHF